jgi:beclin 1
LPGTPVEWEEINAGLGQANLLLYCLARKVKLEFKRFRLVPYGSYSYLEVVENTAGYKIGDELNMYRLKGYKYYFDWDKKFEKGMSAYLDCLRQFEEKIKSLDPQFAMPYKINGFKLEDKNGSSYSIKFQLNSFEEWTKALKYMLTNLKWSLAWVTAMTQNEPLPSSQSSLVA